MKINKLGRKYTMKKLSGTCKNCGCEIECSEDEARYNSYDNYFYMSCPTKDCYEGGMKRSKVLCAESEIIVK